MADLNDIIRGIQKPEQDQTQPPPLSEIDQIFYDIMGGKSVTEPKKNVNSVGDFINAVGGVAKKGAGILSKAALGTGEALGQTLFGGAIDAVQQKKEREANKKLVNAGQELILQDPENADISFISTKLKQMYPEEFKRANLTGVFNTLGAAVDPVADLGDSQLTSAAQIREKKFETWGQGKKALRVGSNVYDLGSATPDDYVSFIQDELQIPVAFNDKYDPKTGSEIYEIDRSLLTLDKWKKLNGFIRSNKTDPGLVRRKFGIDTGLDFFKAETARLNADANLQRAKSIKDRLSAQFADQRLKWVKLALDYSTNASTLPENLRLLKNLENIDADRLSNVVTQQERDAVKNSIDELNNFSAKHGFNPLDYVDNLEKVPQQLRPMVRKLISTYEGSLEGVNNKIESGKPVKTGKKIRVKIKSSGQTGTVPEENFDPKTMDKL